MTRSPVLHVAILTQQPHAVYRTMFRGTRVDRAPAWANAGPMLDKDRARTGSPARVFRALLLTVLFPGGRRGFLQGVARTILYLLLAMVLVFLLLWGILESTTP